ncbi:MAG: fibronectin type III domain-containing protein [Phycisphaerae bacterium]
MQPSLRCGVAVLAAPAVAAKPTTPAAPTDLTATAVSSSQIDLTWTDNSDNEDDFRVERSLDGSSFSEIATVGANVTTYSDTGLSESTTYYYRVRARRANLIFGLLQHRQRYHVWWRHHR